MSLFSRRENDVEAAYDMYADMLYRIALSHLQNADDAMEAVHDAFVKYIDVSVNFRDNEHEKAWLIRVTVNLCYDMLRRRKIRNYIPLENISTIAAKTENSGIFRELEALPAKNRTVIVLHYLEGFSIKEIADMLNISLSAVKMRLARGREGLKESMKGVE